MHYLLSTVALAAFVILASGCRNPTPTFNPYGGFGSPRVAPPAAGGYPASGAAAQPGAYYPGIQQPASMPGGAPAYTSPPPATGSQSQNQQSFGSASNGWQATNGISPGASTASTAGMSETAVNRVTTPTITHGTLNDASFRQSNGSLNNDPAAGLLERIQQGRMRVHDATTPPGAAAPLRAIPTVPTYPMYQVQPSMTSTPSYGHLRGTALTSNSTRTAPAASLSPQMGHSVLSSSGHRQPSASAATTTESSTSVDGLNWRSKQSPEMEVATR